MRPLSAWLQDSFDRSGAGWLHAAQDRFTQRLDPREDFEGDPIDLGVCGEDSAGLWFRRDPFCMLLEDEDLWPVYTAIQAGDVEITRQDRETLAARDFVLKAHAIAAIRREERRKWSAPGVEPDDDH